MDPGELPSPTDRPIRPMQPRVDALGLIETDASRSGTTVDKMLWEQLKRSTEFDAWKQLASLRYIGFRREARWKNQAAARIDITT